ncbi:MAG: hypothetical protein JXC32_02800, partial [Anaerolineae bacterium]|nr:hypothetical protein [Anaerolineae bacterium]
MGRSGTRAALVFVVFLAVSLLAAALVAAQPLSSGPGAAERPAPQADVNWQTWVNDVPWQTGMQVTTETSDTLKVVNVVTTLPNEGSTLVETWTPGRLKLLDVQIAPGGSAHTVEIGRVTWQLPEGDAQVYTMTKWFHVEPSIWTTTVLTETVSVLGQQDTVRRITVNKIPPALWIAASGGADVWPGDVVTLALSYGNTGGYENGVSVRATFPNEAPLAWADPAPDETAPGGLSARWNVGDLAGGTSGEILIAIAVTETPPLPPTLQVWSGIADHVDVVRDQATATFDVQTPVQEIVWEKTVNGEPWQPDLVVTAVASDTFVVQDVVLSSGEFLLTETWDPERLSLVEVNTTTGELNQAPGHVAWAVPPQPGEALLTKVFHVEPGDWDWTVLEEVLEVGDESRVRFVPVRQRPITFPAGPWPWYAQGEIAVHPEPPVARRPTELCAEVVNRDLDSDHPAIIEFAVAPFGIGMLFEPVGLAEVPVPAGGHAEGCTVWVPPDEGHWCIEVRLLDEDIPYLISQRNVDVDEPLVPNTPHERTFPVRNPLEGEATLTLGLVPHLPGWGLELVPDVLPDMEPGEVREVTLAVTPPEDLPEDGAPIVDVEAFVGDELIGGFRKIFRPPVRLHVAPDPPYAEREITVHPYPPRAGEPTELCVELRNPTPSPADVGVRFYWAHFGIGLPFTPINGLRSVHLPAYSVVRECIYWVPPIGGNVCLQVELIAEGYATQRSQRNLDVDEPLRPNVPHTLIFPVQNPFQHEVTITL